MSWTQAQRKYANSEAGKLARQRYLQSEKGKLMRQNYMEKRKAKIQELKERETIIENPITVQSNEEKTEKDNKEVIK